MFIKKAKKKTSSSTSNPTKTKRNSNNSKLYLILKIYVYESKNPFSLIFKKFNFALWYILFKFFIIIIIWYSDCFKGKQLKTKFKKIEKYCLF